MDLEDLFKGLVWDNLVKAALRQLFAAVPLLGWGPIGYVITWAAVYFAGKLYDALKMAVQLEAIVLRNEAHKRAFAEASVKLRLIAKGHGIDSPEFRKARDAHKVALSNFVRFGS